MAELESERGVYLEVLIKYIYFLLNILAKSRRDIINPIRMIFQAARKQRKLNSDLESEVES